MPVPSHKLTCVYYSSLKNVDCVILITAFSGVGRIVTTSTREISGD